MRPPWAASRICLDFYTLVLDLARVLGRDPAVTLLGFAVIIPPQLDAA
jgi:hypothetical protein